MTNEILFILHSTWISVATLCTLFVGKEALIAAITVFTILANLFVTKQITLCGFHVTATDAFAIGATLGMNMLQEYYGNTAARKAIIISFLMGVFFTIASIFHLLYLPNSFDEHHIHFLALLSPLPRIIIASLSTYFLTQYVDYFLFNTLKRKFITQNVSTRYCFSTMLSQLFDTVLFSFLGLYGIVHNIGHLIMVSYTIKLVIIAASTPFVWLSSYIMKGHSHE